MWKLLHRQPMPAFVGTHVLLAMCIVFLGTWLQLKRAPRVGLSGWMEFSLSFLFSRLFGLSLVSKRVKIRIKPISNGSQRGPMKIQHHAQSAQANLPIRFSEVVPDWSATWPGLAHRTFVAPKSFFRTLIWVNFESKLTGLMRRIHS